MFPPLASEIMSETTKTNETEVELVDGETEFLPAEPAAEETGGPVTLTAAEMAELKASAAKADEHWERLLRQAADFENFKKRAARDRQDAIRYANEGLIGQLLPVLDSFDMAVTAAESGQGDMDSLKVGISMILTQFKNALKESGLEELDANGKAFDPTWQEAVSQQESAEVEEGQVLQQVRRGYKLRDRLLRAASVIVAKKPGPESK